MNQAPPVRKRRNSAQMHKDMLCQESIWKSCCCIDECQNCDVNTGNLSVMNAFHTWLYECRVESINIPGGHKKEFITDKLLEVRKAESDTEDFNLVTQNNRQCCETCFKEAMGFDKSVWSTARQAAMNPHVAADVTHVCAKESAAVSWCILKLKETEGSCDPVAGKIMMEPPDRQSWWVEFLGDEKARGLVDKELAGYRTFQRAVSKALKQFSEASSNGIMMRPNLPFSQCGQCHTFKVELAAEKNPAKREEIRVKRRQHQTNQYQERQSYYHHRTKARKHPDKYMSLIVDGMDQAKLEMPHFTRASKSNSNTLGNSIVGVLVHGYGFKQYVVSHAMKGGANEMVTILNTAIRELQVEYARLNKPWPKVCYIQSCRLQTCSFAKSHTSD